MFVHTRARGVFKRLPRSNVCAGARGLCERARYSCAFAAARCALAVVVWGHLWSASVRVCAQMSSINTAGTRDGVNGGWVA